MDEKAEKIPQNSNNDFMKLEDWDNHFRVMSDPIVWYETWIEDDGKKRPSRTAKPLAKEPDNIVIGKYGPQFNKYFWAFIVWSYDSECLQFLQIDKKGVLFDIENYLSDEDKCDPRKYDMIVTKAGSWVDTTYALRVKDNKPVSKDIKAERDKLSPFVSVGNHLKWAYVLKEAREEMKSNAGPEGDLPF